MAASSRLCSQIVLCLSIGIWALPQSFAEDRASGHPAQLLAENLIKVYGSIHSFKGFFEDSQSLQAPDGAPIKNILDFKVPSVAHTQYEIAFSDKDIYCRSEQMPPSGNALIVVLHSDVVKDWRQDPVGPGFGNVNLPDEKSQLTMRINDHCPWRDLTASCDLDPTDPSLKVTDGATYDGKKCVALEWENKLGKRQMFVAVDDKTSSPVPLYVEKVEGAFKVVIEFHEFKAINGVQMPTKIVHKLVAPASETIKMSGGTLPSGFAKETPLAFVRELDARDMWVNETMDPELFHLNWMRGTQVNDHLKGSRYFVGENKTGSP